MFRVKGNMNNSESDLDAAAGETHQVCDMTGQKKCSNCATEFHCGAAAAQGAAGFSCWCGELPHVSPVAAVDQDCLCPECLSQAIGTAHHPDETVAS